MASTQGYKHQIQDGQIQKDEKSRPEVGLGGGGCQSWASDFICNGLFLMLRGRYKDICHIP